MYVILKYFPNSISELIQNTLDIDNTSIEEIRIRIGLPIILSNKDNEYIIEHKITREEINEIVQKICENSLYSYQKQISQGYITINGGHRVGIVGSAVIEDNKIINLNYISGLNFRISKQVINCSENIINDIINISNNTIFNTLIVSPPGLGKTTLLKDIVRKISNGNEYFKGLTITVVDERGEIAASCKGIAQNDLGIRTDVLDNMPKAIGMKMAIRSMAPKIIVADEIGNIQDAEAIKYAVCCGVKGIFTAHGSTIKDLHINPALHELIESKVFERILLLKNRTNNIFIKDTYKLNNEKKDYIL